MPTDRGRLAALPEWYWGVPYVAARTPGAVPREQLRNGANCQLWAYGVLAYFGHDIPDLRSDELWCDNSATDAVVAPDALDIVLFSGDGNPHGAHVGIWTGSAVAHLCREVGRPVIWPLEEFGARPRYAVRIGFKRPKGSAPG